MRTETIRKELAITREFAKRQQLLKALWKLERALEATRKKRKPA